MLAKRDLKAGEAVLKDDIADIRGVRFRDIEIKDTDKLICCLKVGWKFALFFDFHPEARLNISEMTRLLGNLYRYLTFQEVYKVLETESSFQEMMKEGWFPFIEIIASDYKALSSAYMDMDKFDFENRISKVVKTFDRTRVDKITSRWWTRKAFSDKKPILQAGINAFLRDDNEGYINCIKTLLTEAEGIIRLQYLQDTSKGKSVKTSELLEYVVEKGKARSGSDYSLLLPLPFFNYLKDVVFKSFDLESGDIDLSRHSSSHGVAKVEDYTKMKAVQTILILDQLYFYF